MADDEVARNLNSMDDLDFTAWNGADWHGLDSKAEGNLYWQPGLDAKRSA